MQEEYGREMASEAACRDLAERLCSVEAAHASDTQEYRQNFMAVEARLEEERARRVRAEANLAKQETGHQAMEKALDGDFPRDAVLLIVFVVWSHGVVMFSFRNDHSAPRPGR